MAKKKKSKTPGDRILANNKKAYHDYFITDKYEAGISLTGTEVKSLREGRANLKESYCRARNGEVFLIDCHISPYTHGNDNNHDPIRERKLLLHKREIFKLVAASTQKGFTVVPLRFYLKGAKVKLEIGLGQGKHNYDKRESLRNKDIDRETERAMRDRSI
jgi:SsrA-binding protein